MKLIFNIIENCRKMAAIAWMVVATLLLISSIPAALAADKPQGINSNQVMEVFDRQQVERVDEGTIVSDKKKQIIMFALGVPLLILLLTTGAIGIAMGVYGKQVFVLHMVFAGLTITLALVHVIVGLVWFYPF